MPIRDSLPDTFETFEGHDSAFASFCSEGLIKDRNNRKSNFRHLQRTQRPAQHKSPVPAAAENDDNMSRREAFRTSSDEVVQNNRTAEYAGYCEPSQGISVYLVAISNISSFPRTTHALPESV
jgi:hypothetical protein